MIGLLLAMRTAIGQCKGEGLAGLALLAVAVGAAWMSGYTLANAGKQAAIEAAVVNAVAAERISQSKARELALQDAHKEYSKRVQLGEQAAQGLRAELAARDRRISNLQRSVAHVAPLVASEACPRPDDVRLSVGAVRLYDAALGAGPGGAGEQLPGGACGAAAGAGAASAAGAGCEQPSAVTVGRLREVAQANAELQGECMTRLQRLVEFLKTSR